MTIDPPSRSGLLLLGAGGHGRVVADLAETTGWSGIAFLDDRSPDLQNNRVWPVLGRLTDLSRFRGAYGFALVTIGDNHARLELQDQLLSLSFQVPSLVHPSAVISRYARLGRGVVVMANVVVNAFAEIGDGVILNTASTIDHDCLLESGVHISPGAHLSGNVQVGSKTWIGVGASVREGVRIGQGVMVGAGATVVSDLPDAVLALGTPARCSPRI